MFNPPNSYQNSGSYDELLKRMTQHVKKSKIDNQIVEILQDAFEKEFSKENIVLSRPERVRLFQQVSKAILTDVIGNIGNAK